jgi:signal transduction histidine kinase
MVTPTTIPPDPLPPETASASLRTVGPDTAPGEPAVSKLAAKVAHELNNPLDAVLRFVSLAQRKAKSGDYSGIDRYLADAQFGLQRMAEILRELMDIGRETHDILAKPERLAVAELVAHAVRTVAGLAEQRRIDVVVLHQDASANARYDLRVSQVLANLLKNAVEASPEGGVVRLTIGSPTGQSAELLLEVEDRGSGVPPALLPELFTPFVTTKPRGKGHGLGLAISRELTLSIGGSLTLENRPDGGCLARLTLPVS